MTLSFTRHADGVGEVIFANVVNELQVALEGLGGIEVEIDFGSTPVDEKEFAITDAKVNATTTIVATHSGKAAAGKDADENEMDALLLRALPGSGSFTLWATAVPGPVTGTFKVSYTRAG